jgi:hypothetical protein
MVFETMVLRKMCDPFWRKEWKDGKESVVETS